MTAHRLTKGQKGVLGTAAGVMTVVGITGAVGTFSNVLAEFGREATAAGVVAAGEGLTLILALTMLGLTLLGQSSPAWVRIGLWLAPLAACGTGLSLADNLTEAVVYGATPLGMSGAAEGLGLIARRVVIYTTGVDAEAHRRNADAVQQLAYHQAAAERHPDEDVREASLRQSWTLAKKVGVGDAQLGAALVGVQRARITEGADHALGGMYGKAPAIEPPARPRTVSATDVLRERFATMDPADAIRLAADARPDAPPAELAHVLGGYGVVVDAVAVALVLGQRPAEYEAHQVDAPAHQQVTDPVPALEPLTVEGIVVEAASTLGADASAREIAEHIARHRRLVVTEPYVRTALSRAARKPQPEVPAKPMEGGYA
ncbi:conjugal transfer protein [Streptomyces scabiei]|uniref:conjugal transfer protein n=1 Tax=Streptomyces scabiei TaxID=1930 RepID=UPI001B31508C|nr:MULTISPECIES: conjugal transfer protein [unclassified Streptomyces]MBP5884522.1 conjugal transfer protein [Streptomyces sp. LBUM 1487]QTU47620.1 conjugal transfer protein [Streptomyces sp. LBUM 1482]